MSLFPSLRHPISAGSHSVCHFCDRRIDGEVTTMWAGQISAISCVTCNTRENRIRLSHQIRSQEPPIKTDEIQEKQGENEEENLPEDGKNKELNQGENENSDPTAPNKGIS